VACMAGSPGMLVTRFGVIGGRKRVLSTNGPELANKLMTYVIIWVLTGVIQERG
jgi:hypothetical protein